MPTSPGLNRYNRGVRNGLYWGYICGYNWWAFDFDAKLLPAQVIVSLFFTCISSESDVKELGELDIVNVFKG